MGNRATSTTSATLAQCDPWLALALRIVQIAKQDAAKGDLGAVVFLLTDGTRIADQISDGASEAILSFCREVLAQVDAGKVKKKWETVTAY